MNMHVPFRHPLQWQDKHDAFILECRLDGLSAAQTAERLNEAHGTYVTRNAIIGRWNRLNAPPLVKPSKPATVAKPKVRKSRAANQPRPPVPLRVYHLAQPSRAKLVGVIAVKDELRKTAVTLMELKHSHCRYLLDTDEGEDRLYCGDVALDGGSYCQDHHRLCYKPVSQATSGERRAAYIPRIVREGARP